MGNSAFSPAKRFRDARERAGISIAEFAKRVSLSKPSVWDLETMDDELTMVYSPAELQKFASVLGVRPSELVGLMQRDDSITHIELATAIREYCRIHQMNVEQFSETVGWEIAPVMESSERFLSDFSLDGTRDLCSVLGLDWDRFISGL